MSNAPIITRDQLLELDYLANYIKNSSNNTLAQIELKEKAKENKLPMRDFQKLLKQAEDSLVKPIVYTPKKFTIPDVVSSTITNYGSYLIDEDGVKLIINNNIIEVCPHPLFIYEIITDYETNQEKIKLAYFKKTSGWVYDIIVDRVQIATARGIIQLANYNIMANDSNAGYLVKYLCDIEMLNLTNLKNIHSASHLGKTKFGYIPYSKNITFDMQDKANTEKYLLYKTNGNFNIWCNAQIEIFNYTIPKICIAMSYASITFEMFGLNPFGVHLWGDTGKGKSVAILAAASVYGYPSIYDGKGIVYTGNTTVNGLESRAAFLKNYCLFLDETSNLTPDQINNMIYLVMQGQGKGRMSQGAKTQASHTWNLGMLSNAETPVTNDYAKGGIFNRIIQINPSQSIFGDCDMVSISNTFKENYGFGLPLFIDILENPLIVEELSLKRKQYYNELICMTEDKQANAGSILLATFDIIANYIYGTEKRLTVAELKRFLFTKDEVSQVMRIYNKFIDWTEANYIYFNDEVISNQNKWGKIQGSGLYKFNIHILPTKLEDFCNKVGIDTKQFVIGLKDRGLLVTQKGKNTNRFRLEDKVCACYTIKKEVECYDEC